MDVVSQDNIRRLFDQDPDKALENDSFLKTLKENQGNVEAQQELLRSSNALKYDFTQHYNQATGESTIESKSPTVHVEHVAEIGAA